MGQQFFDARLRTLTGLKCPDCRRHTAQGTGEIRELDGGGVDAWMAEYWCSHCGETYWYYFKEAFPLLRQAARDRRERQGRAGSPIVSGTIGDDGSVERDGSTAGTRGPPPLLRMHEVGSDLAATLGRPFLFTVSDAGALEHEELPAPGVRSLPFRRRVEAPAVLHRLQRLFAAADFDHLPPVVGRGHGETRVEWRGSGTVEARILRWTQQGSARDFGGDRLVTRPVVELVDALRQIIGWVDADGPPSGLNDAATQGFPRVDDLLWQARAARLAVTADWSGAQKVTRVRELWLSESGRAELRDLRRAGLVPALERSRVGRLADDLVARAFDSLTRLDPPQFRRQLGYVRESCDLEHTSRQVLDFFDGERVHSTTFVSGGERGFGVGYGDVPPTEQELAAFDLLSGLFGQV